jgi:uncharacterized protein YyaL (SSP411 family)
MLRWFEPRQALGCALVGILSIGIARAAEPKRTQSESMSQAPETPAHTNRLAREKSPYLLQHQHNPVDWYPWGNEAFEKARREDKPIFLSIGYSTCHWCHVMERESFEKAELAEYLNAHFVSIKIDREERPDVDQIYMTAIQAMSGQGGWPLNIFLTPDLKPFYGGTYFPPEPKFGRPSFLQVLQNIQRLWTTRRDELAKSASEMHDRLGEFMAGQAATNLTFTPALLHNAADLFKGEFDPRHGGFGGSPKFPRPSQPAFLLRAGSRFHDKEAIRMVLETCDHMAAGGINDHLGGGFARYSVDAEWLVPHFEKMLYDNAQLLDLYLNAWLVSGDERHAAVARSIIDYVLRDMTHPNGGFFSAEDADSEGKEGKFYCWTQEELTALLQPDEFKVAGRYFGVTRGGNFVDHSDPHPLPNQNVLSVVHPKLSSDEARLLESAKRKMFDTRIKRVRPHLDDKILSSWNGLMLGALAHAYGVLGDERYRDAAEKNVRFIQTNLWDAKEKKLYHRWRDGERDSVQLLDAYADLLSGIIELYQVTLDPKHLEFSIALAETLLATFYDSAHGGFFESPAGSADLILRAKDDYDGAEPSGNSMASLALLKLAAITERKEFSDAAEKTIRLFGDRVKRMPQAVPYLLLAVDYMMETPRRAVVVGDPNDPGTKRLVREIHSVYQPNKVVLGTAGPVEPFAKTLPTKDAPMVFLCTGTACQPPTRDSERLKELLRDPVR